MFLNVTESGMTRKKINAHILVKTLRDETLHQNRWMDEKIETDQLLIEKTILDYPANDALKVLLIEAFDGEKKIVESKDLILIK